MGGNAAGRDLMAEGPTMHPEAVGSDRASFVGQAISASWEHPPAGKGLCSRGSWWANAPRLGPAPGLGNPEIITFARACGRCWLLAHVHQRAQGDAAANQDLRSKLRCFSVGFGKTQTC